MVKQKAHATPTKDFFVRMITKDISLEDCILDLIDNCLDGARKVRNAASAGGSVDEYSGFKTEVDFTEEHFTISDNCGGIKISEAIDYAFHFGRRVDAPVDEDYPIGLYGIGMKRAIFKLGNQIEIYSSTSQEAFSTHIDVKEWLGRAPISAPGQPPREDWDFDMDDAPVNPNTGTKISVTELYPSVSAQFANPEFGNTLSRIIARDYAQFFSKGFEIFINGKKPEAFQLTVRESADFKPIRQQYADETGVTVEIIAGMAGPPPDSLEPSDRRPETEYYGWFVVCNDRVVVASDKSDRTVWGNGGFQAWHYQYNGFIGVVSFLSKNPNLLPWTTTKRDLDESNPIYRRAIEKMKEATRLWITYTNDRKTDIATAKVREAAAVAKPLFDVPSNPIFVVPKISPGTGLVSFTSIQYTKPSSEVAKVKKMLGNPRMPNYRVGEMTFDYYVKNESEE